ncbi:hypothetical protein [Streptomyces sp. TRM68367]|uniref:hypothetical protein n=1 Tax=Streptomyces sp. TRM68367 TaxID=2758415 RepID=UPI00165A8D4D|nr:hypothetical protein [Streptomyces sp. TRM68367]MBC9729248.1 hypothetical protein [Streptomyces sp. TRM68367]
MTFPAEPSTTPMETLYALLDNGGVYATSWEQGQPGSQALPSPGRIVTQDEYQARLDEINAANGQRVVDAEAARQHEARADYDALIGAGIPAATAQRLTGYTQTAG